jgi:hypothetical protein
MGLVRVSALTAAAGAVCTLFCVVMCTACASRPVRLDASEFRGRPVSTAQRVVLESEGDERGYIDIASGGAFVTQLGRQRVRVVHVRLTVKNDDADELRIPLDVLALEGIGGDRLRPLAVYPTWGDREVYAASMAIPPGEIRATDVIFALPYGVAVTDVDRFSLFWGVDLPGDVIRKATVFAPSGQRGAMARSFRPASYAE